MKLKVLGSSSKGNCYLLEGKDETLILECGIRYKDILKGLDFNLKNVVGCLVTHEHKDHSKALQDLLKVGINVYTSMGTARAITKEFYSIETHHRLKFIESEIQFKVGGFTILPFQTQHDAAEPLGFLIQHSELGKMVFATDTYYIQYKFNGLNHILTECNYENSILEENIKNGLIPMSLRNRLIKSHFSLENVKDFLKASDLKKVINIVLIHLSDSNSDPDIFKSEIENVTGKPVYIAKEGLEIDLEL